MWTGCVYWRCGWLTALTQLNWIFSRLLRYSPEKICDQLTLSTLFSTGGMNESWRSRFAFLKRELFLRHWLNPHSPLPLGSAIVSGRFIRSQCEDICLTSPVIKHACQSIGLIEWWLCRHTSRTGEEREVSGRSFVWYQRRKRKHISLHYEP